MGIKHAQDLAAFSDNPAYGVSKGEYVADHVVDAFALPEDISPTQLAANTDNWAPAGLSTAAVIRVSTDKSRNLTGLTGGADGRVIVLMNVGSYDLVLKHDVTSTAANRFYCPNSADMTLPPNGSAVLVYDSTSSRWRTGVLGGIVGAVGRAVYAQNYNPTDTPVGQSIILPALGGTVAIPFFVPAPGLLNGVYYRHNTGGTNPSYPYVALYKQVGASATAKMVAHWTLIASTPGGYERTAVDSAPVSLSAGFYWLIIKNINGAGGQTMYIGKSANALPIVGCRTKTIDASDPGDNLDMSTGWTTTTDNVFAALEFRVFGESGLV